MDDAYYRSLAQRYLDGKLTDSELEAFIHLLNEGKMDAYLKQAINAEAGISDEHDAEYSAPAKIRFIHNNWLRYAAAVVLLIGVFAAVFINKWQQKDQLTASNSKVSVHDALPGGNKAVLVLANGDSIILNNASNGQIACQGNANVNKIQNGALAYRTGNTDTATVWNTISTPRGGQYNIQLADGSMVWLNSASSITFPTAFNGDSRRVQISGEVYFEVAKNAAKPFFVQSGTQTVQVLGTHFNINAYNDEPGIRTTLLEGSIRINTGSQSRLMIPGQQVMVDGNNITMLKDPNTAAVTAWKDGLFVFDGADLPQLMRQLARWYDVDIVYQGKPGDHAFVGDIKRNTRLSSVLKILAASGLKWKLQDKQLIIQH